ncbi:hypothetical protein [Corynebacterium mastitidis]|uniref:hypothetical protein n=1 Tax=Corynebacterium mastitidis TaxID=161890 RepID=UPI00254AB7F7|nr:hypothetical protein [Corynebacterium mastitidis]
MGQDWFGDRDADDVSQGQQRSARWDDLDASIETVPMGEGEATRSRTTGVNWWVVVAVGVVGMVVIGSAGSLFFWSHDAPAESPHEPDLVAPGVSFTSAPASEAQQIKAAPACQEVEPDPTDPQGVVVAFQQAYYHQDVAGIEQLLAPNSALRATNWEEVLSVVAPAEVCATTTVTGQGVVAADVTVTSDEERHVYLQEYHLVEQADGFVIVSIADRSQK